MKLGKRLTAIEGAVATGYDAIWDCCCDHGLLGFQLLKQEKGRCVHFVDIVPSLMQEIEEKLTRFYRGDAQWQVHCLDVARLPLSEHGQEKQLIIIAGVGGLLMIELLTTLFPLTKGKNIEFILSPVHHNYQLRAFLKAQECGLADEFIVAENKRYYEVLHIDNRAAHQVSLVGERMWNFDDPEHRDYLQQTIAHYQRMANNPDVEVEAIVRAYQDLLRE